MSKTLFFLMSILMLLTSKLYKANVEWHEIQILDVIQLFNYETNKNNQAIIVKEFDSSLIIKDNLESCKEISAGNVINIQAILIADPYV